MVVQAAPANPLISPPCLNLFSPVCCLPSSLSSFLCCPLLFRPHTQSPFLLHSWPSQRFFCCSVSCEVPSPLLWFPTFFFFNPILSHSLFLLSCCLSLFHLLFLSCPPLCLSFSPVTAPLPLSGCCVVSARPSQLEHRFPEYWNGTGAGREIH